MRSRCAVARSLAVIAPFILAMTLSQAAPAQSAPRPAQPRPAGTSSLANLRPHANASQPVVATPALSEQYAGPVASAAYTIASPSAASRSETGFGSAATTSSISTLLSGPSRSHRPSPIRGAPPERPTGPTIQEISGYSTAMSGNSTPRRWNGRGWSAPYTAALNTAFMAPWDPLAQQRPWSARRSSHLER